MWKVCLVVAMVGFVLVGCEMMRRVDQAVWQSPGPEVEGEPPAPPPIVEVVAGLLAAGGFGGMATWLRKQGNGTRRSLGELSARITALEREIEKR